MNQPDPASVKEAEALLDRLLGVEARRPGKAAQLPAAIRIIEKLEPAGGFAVPVFPSSYAGPTDKSPPVYDLAGIEYGEAVETIRSKERERVVRPILRAKLCALDAPQAQANRMEPAFIEDEALRRLVPQGQATIPRTDGNNGSEHVLRLPHRVADFRVRLSDQGAAIALAIAQFADGNALPLLRMMPTSVLFGFWDSRGNQAKHARILLARIDAFDVVPCNRHALYSGPYSKEEFTQTILNGRATTDAEKKKMAEQGYTNAPSDGLGGVLVQGRIERLALLSLTDLARVFCVGEGPNDAETHTNAARRYLFALAGLAEGHARATGSHRLRSGCELVHAGESAIAIDLRGGGSNYADADALKKLFLDRMTLVKIAENATAALGIPATLNDFTVTRELLLADFGAAETTATPTTTAAASPLTTPAPDRRRRS